MAKNSYYAIDPTSSSEVVLDDLSGTPNTQVLSLTTATTYTPITGTLVGCTYGTSYEGEERELIITIRLEIQSRSMDDIYSKMDDLDTALQGDRSVPGGTKKFSVKIAQDGTDYYGWENCYRIALDSDLRAYHRASGVDYPLVEPPYLTIATIVAATKYTELTEL